MENIRVFELFAGIMANSKALKRLGVPHELVGFSEIDKYAIKSACAVHNISESLNYGDISKIDASSLPDFDLLTWGFPCQDISVAGKQKGIIEGETRSGLYYEGLRILKAKRPKYSLIENVKNLTSKKFRPQFEQMLKDLEELGYNNYYPPGNSSVLNAKDYGIPQNRERVFILSILKEVDPFTNGFEWPKPFDNGLRLKHMLETNVDEKYYISDEKCARLLQQLNGIPNDSFYSIGNTNPSGKGMNGHVWAGNICPTITTNKGECMKIVEPIENGGVIVREATKKGFSVAYLGDSINLEQPNSKTRQGRVGRGVAQTLTCSCNQAVVEQVGIDFTYNNPQSREIANCISARQDRGISNRKQEGTGVLVVEPFLIDDQGRLSKEVKPLNICPTLRAQDHGNPPKVVEPLVRVTEDGFHEYRNDHKKSSIQGTHVNFPNGRIHCMSVAHVPKVLEPNECIMAGSLDHYGNDQMNRVYSPEGIEPTIRVVTGGGREQKIYWQYRIRKLTPKECWRLMGFDDSDFEKASKVCSNSQLYKQAGNSIVVNVLEEIYKNLFGLRQNDTM